MTCPRLMPLLCCALLAACQGGPVPTPAVQAAPTVAAAMAQADAAVLAGRTDQAYTILKLAGTTFPKEKTPWVRMAQMRFDSTDYGRAIVDAQEALARDGDDMLANSIVAVSGLRVTSKALADLSQKNNLTGNVRSEAQELAKLLRSNLNEDALVPGRTGTAHRDGPAKRQSTPPATGAATAFPPAAPVGATRATSSDPFGSLK